MLAFAAAAGYAQALQDPMRPPGFAASSAADSAVSFPLGPVLQSTLLSNGRRIAMIDGKPMKIGDKIGDARILAIDPASVTLREGRTTRVLELFHGVQVTNPKAEEKPVSAGKGMQKGS
jgi:MSHA biogenesis protein MshK